jgi:hypothetical protein
MLEGVRNMRAEWQRRLDFDKAMFEKAQAEHDEGEEQQRQKEKQRQEAEHNPTGSMTKAAALKLFGYDAQPLPELWKQVESKYRKAASAVHPDKNPHTDTTELFKSWGEAKRQLEKLYDTGPGASGKRKQTKTTAETAAV